MYKINMVVLVKDIEITLYNDQNETLVGLLNIANVNNAPPSNRLQGNNSYNSTGNYSDELSPWSGYLDDQSGAATYVVSVILIYGLAIVFMIASHVFVKRKEQRWENQLPMVDKYFQEAAKLRELDTRESYRKLKHSMIPVVAKSSAKNLLSRRRSFLPILAEAGVTLDTNNEGDTAVNQLLLPLSEQGAPEQDHHYLTVPTFLEIPPPSPSRKLSNSIPHMPALSEENTNSDIPIHSNARGDSKFHQHNGGQHRKPLPIRHTTGSDYRILPFWIQSQNQHTENEHLRNGKVRNWKYGNPVLPKMEKPNINNNKIVSGNMVHNIQEIAKLENKKTLTQKRKQFVIPVIYVTDYSKNVENGSHYSYFPEYSQDYSLAYSPGNSAGNSSTGLFPGNSQGFSPGNSSGYSSGYSPNNSQGHSPVQSPGSRLQPCVTPNFIKHYEEGIHVEDKAANHLFSVKQSSICDSIESLTSTFQLGGDGNITSAYRFTWVSDNSVFKDA